MEDDGRILYLRTVEIFFSRHKAEFTKGAKRSTLRITVLLNLKKYSSQIKK